MTHFDKSEDARRLTIMIPTRERASYLGHAIHACLRAPVADMEVLVLDNASCDETRDVIQAIGDGRIRYERSEQRLSMRDNFERGLELARGRIICSIGDDDAIIASRLTEALAVFDDPEIQALSADRVHYAWPDIQGGRRNSVLVPRREGMRTLKSRIELHGLLKDGNYYNLPCIYHGFVRKSLIDKIKDKQGRFFLSSQVDMFSSIALSMEDICYRYSLSPYFINGGSARSNGASHFKGGTEQEKNLWRIEDDLGFLPAFQNWVTVKALIVESALRYCAAHGHQIDDIFARVDLEVALGKEINARRAKGHPDGDADMLRQAVGGAGPFPASITPHRISRIIRSFLAMRPADMARNGRHDVDAVAQWVDETLASQKLGLTSNTVDQIRTALAIARD